MTNGNRPTLLHCGKEGVVFCGLRSHDVNYDDYDWSRGSIIIGATASIRDEVVCNSVCRCVSLGVAYFNAVLPIILIEMVGILMQTRQSS